MDEDRYWEDRLEAEEDRQNQNICQSCGFGYPDHDPSAQEAQGCSGCGRYLCRDCWHAFQGCERCCEDRDAANPIDLVMAVVEQARQARGKCS